MQRDPEVREALLEAFKAAADNRDGELLMALNRLPTEVLQTLDADATWLASRARSTWRSRRDAASRIVVTPNVEY